MSLPTPNTDWPPAGWEDTFQLYNESAAWYSGDPVQLSNYYASATYTPTPSGAFWAKDVSEKRRIVLHVPLAQDIARTSANLLFSEPPEISVAGADEVNESGQLTRPAAVAAQDRLIEILDANNFNALLLEAAESCAAFGGVLLKLNVDSNLRQHPIVSVVQADSALPEFRFGVMTACTLWRVVETDSKMVLRHIERHEPGRILNGLFEGTSTNLGAQVPLDRHWSTADLQDVVTTGLTGLACYYIPNLRPNRRYRDSYLGVSDFAGVYTLLDSLDEVWTSWVRDVRLAVSRVFVSEGMLDEDSSGNLAFDIDKEAWVQLSTVGEVGGSIDSQITFNQFEIRAQQHQQTCDALVREIIGRVGYAPQSFGLDINGTAESGTALRMRERKSLSTSAGKARYWRSGLEAMLYDLQTMDAYWFRTGIQPHKVTVEIQDSVLSSDVETATTIEILSRAAAMSTEIKVRRLHPEWSDEEVAAEVKRINSETGTAVPDFAQFAE